MLNGGKQTSFWTNPKAKLNFNKWISKGIPDDHEKLEEGLHNPKK